MLRLQSLSPQTEADLQKLVEPLASYISTTNRPRVTLLLAFILLVGNLRDIDDAAKDYLATFSENHVG